MYAKARVINERDNNSKWYVAGEILNHGHTGKWFVDDDGKLFQVVQYQAFQFQLISSVTGNRQSDVYNNGHKFRPVNVEITIKD